MVTVSPLQQELQQQQGPELELEQLPLVQEPELEQPPVP